MIVSSDDGDKVTTKWRQQHSAAKVLNTMKRNVKQPVLVH